MLAGFRKNVVCKGYEFYYTTRLGIKKTMVIAAESLNVATMEMERLSREKKWRDFSFKSFVTKR